jgi:thioredoxin 1
VSKVVEATPENFNELIQGEDVLVDFWAEWCAPCKMISPILDDIAESRGDQLTVVKVNIDDCQKIAQQYRVRGIPTLIRFKSGQVDATKVGAATKSQLEAFLSS